MPACDGPPRFTVAPLAAGDYQHILPLGNLSPPQHTIPTEHIYYVLKGEFRDEGVNPETNPPAVVPVRAPGDVTIVGINLTSAFVNGAQSYTDHDVLFSDCRDRLFKLIHVSTLSPELAQLLEGLDSSVCDDHTSGTRRNVYCETRVSLDVEAGDVLGTAGGLRSVALDLAAHDFTAPPLPFANRERYRGRLSLSLYAACALDAFEEGARAEQLARMKREANEAGVSDCGRVAQDVPSTARGNWFLDEMSRLANWDEQLALVLDNVDPSLAAISIGGTLMQPSLWYFEPASEGTLNRAFDEVQLDGKTYCYEGAVGSQGQRGASPEFPGRLLVELRDETTLLVELQEGGCAGQPQLSTPITYLR